MRVLVTGGSGFIGSHLVCRFAELGWEVHAPHRGSALPWRLADVSRAGKVVMHPDSSLEDAEMSLSLVESIKPEAVVHAAAYGVQADEQHAPSAFAANTYGTALMAEACRRANVGRLVILGTGLEYEGSDHPLDEKAPLKPYTLYGATKASGWMLADFYSRQYGLGLTTLRAFNIFGPRENIRKLVPHVISCALRSRPVTLDSNLEERDFLYVGDLVEVVVMAAEERLPAGEVFNVCSATPVNVRGVAERILQMMDCGAVLETDVGSHAREQRPSLVGTNEKLRSFGWTPKWSLDDGLRATIAWYRENQDSLECAE